MARRPGTVRERLGDPASWPSVPADFAPPNESYLLAKLASIVADGKWIQIHFWAGGQRYVNDLEVEDSIEANRIVARLQPRVGDLLLEALDTDISEKPM